MTANGRPGTYREDRVRLADRSARPRINVYIGRSFLQGNQEHCCRSNSHTSPERPRDLIAKHHAAGQIVRPWPVCRRLGRNPCGHSGRIRKSLVRSQRHLSVTPTSCRISPSQSGTTDQHKSRGSDATLMVPCVIVIRGRHAATIATWAVEGAEVFARIEALCMRRLEIEKGTRWKGIKLRLILCPLSNKSQRYKSSRYYLVTYSADDRSICRVHVSETAPRPTQLIRGRPRIARDPCASCAPRLQIRC